MSATENAALFNFFCIVLLPSIVVIVFGSLRLYLKLCERNHKPDANEHTSQFRGK